MLLNYLLSMGNKSVKTAILILSDPKSETEEVLGRVFNGLACAYDYIQTDTEVTVIFMGAGTRWLGVLSNPDHILNGLFELTKGVIEGASAGCADVFGVTDEIMESEFKLVAENMVPGTKGLPSLKKLVSDGFNILTF